MDLPSELVTQLVQMTKDDNKSKHETTLFGTIVERDGVNYVQLDGSNCLTPMLTTVVAKPGERVTVLIKNHSAIVTGNITSPAPRGEAIANLEQEMSNVVTTDKLNTINTKIENLQTEDNSIKGRLTAVENDIGRLDREKMPIGNVGGLTVTGSSIYSGSKASISSISNGIYMDNEGQIAIGDSENFIKYYKDDTGAYKLSITIGGKDITSE